MSEANVYFRAKNSTVFTTLNQQNAQTCCLDIYNMISHLIFLHVSKQCSIKPFGFMLHYFVWFSDYGNLQNEIFRNFRCDIITQISKKQWYIFKNQQNELIKIKQITKTMKHDFCCCSTVHFDKYQSFLWPTNAHFINIKMLKCPTGKTS
jgi:hypothetical protein